MKHEIEMHCQVTVENKDVSFEVHGDGEKIGTLKVSKGSIEWVPKHQQTGFNLYWMQFDELMQEHAKKYA